MRSRFSALLLIVSVILLMVSVVGCRSVSEPADASSPPYAPSSPTQEASIENTSEPIETIVPDSPVFTISAFGECAELIARITPGDGEDELHYAHISESGSSYEGGPECFFVSGDKIYFRDPTDWQWSSLFVYDIVSGEGRRIYDHPEEDDRFAPFAVYNGLVITNSKVFDPETSKSMELEPPVPAEYDVISFFISGSDVYLLAGDDDSVFTSMLDLGYPAAGRAPGWTEARDVCSGEPAEDPSSTIWTFGKLGKRFATMDSAAYLGDGQDGSHYFWALLSESDDRLFEGEHTETLVFKTDADGNLIKAVSPETSWDELYGGCCKYLLNGDGTVYLMLGLPDRLLVYRIDL
ncbi:MAG: hypothetical protein IKP26_03855 [Clostridia bacterium]|nr:hypothetical protein [Clostridia bacterium]